MDSAKLALEYLVAGNASDALLAQATRELLGRPGRRAIRSPSGALTGAPRPAEAGTSAPVPEAQPLMQERSAQALNSQEQVSAPEGVVRTRGGSIPGLRPELVRVNVRIGGKRTSLSFPRPAWAVLERRFGGRSSLLSATEHYAQRFRGRGSRSAWVLDQLELQAMRDGVQASLLPLPTAEPVAVPSVAVELRSVLQDLFTEPPQLP